MKRITFLFLLFFMAFSSIYSMDFQSASGRFGVTLIANKAENRSVDPVIVNTLGGSVDIAFAQGHFLSLNPGLDFFWSNYEYADGRACPTQSERGEDNNAFVVAFLLDVPLKASFHFSQYIGASVSLGTAFLLRAAFSYDTSDAAVKKSMAQNLNGIVSYFWDKGRWFYPSVGLSFDVFLQQGFTFSIGAKGFLPVYNAWTGAENFWDESIIQISMEMVVSI